jgi:nucleotide-binding universal stress UspA family protein
MYSKIVVGTDGSDTASGAVSQAIELAKICGADVHLVTGYKTASAMSTMAPETAAYRPSDVEVRRTAETVLERAASQVRNAGLKVETHAVPGNGAEAVIQVAEGQSADLIVVGSRGMTGARRLLGSVPNNVAHHAPCAVLIVQTTS